MAEATPRRSFWQSARELPGRMPLRVKLMTAVLALVTIALVVISVAGIAILKTSLLGPYDNQLEGYIGPVVHSAVVPYLTQGATSQAQGAVVDWIPAGGNVRQVVEPYTGVESFPGLAGPGRPMSPPTISSDPAWIAAHLNRPFTVAAQSGPVRWRVLMETIQGRGGGTVVYALDASSVYTTIGKLTSIDLLVSLAVLCLVGVLGVALVRASLRALTDIEKTAGAIAAGDMSRRVPERDPRTEVGRLGRSLNVMLSQIESAFQSRSRSEAAARRSEERMRQFVGDASHELRTPLTAIRGFAEYYRQRGGIAGRELTASGDCATGEGTPGDVAANPGHDGRGRQLAPADMDRIMRRVEQESARMGILVEDMLLLARLDQQRPLTEHPVDLLTLAGDAVHDARVVAPSRSINLTVSSSRALLVIGDEVRLRQVIGNLMSNALTHTPDGTPIEVVIRSGNLDEVAAATAVARPDAAGESGFADQPDAAEAAADGDVRFDAGHVPPPPGSAAPDPPAERISASRVPAGPAAVLEVTDHGPGLTREQAGHVFERFYRADAARTTGGTGLGLAIVAALVAAHGGTCWVTSRPGEGATFSFALPLSPDAMQVAEIDVDGDTDEAITDTAPGESDNSEPRSADGRATGPGAAYSARVELR